MTALPKEFQWLLAEPGPKMLVEALKHYGVLEHVGKGSNEMIMKWAKEVGVAGWYLDDDVPWCGLFVAIVTLRCKYPHVNWANVLGARYWADEPSEKWKGYGLKIPIAEAKLMDILVFKRSGGEHVAFYVGETKTMFAILGGNQGNRVSITWKLKTDCIDARRPDYKIGVPSNIRKIYLAKDGQLSTNEA